MTSQSDALARKIADQLLAREGTGAAWGIEIEEVRVGYARVAMVVRADMLNGYRTAHGGMVFSLADTAFAYACNSRNISSMAQQASIVFLAPAREGDRLIAEAHEEAVVGRAGSYRVAVRNQTGEAVAAFHGMSRSVGGAVV